MTRFFFVFFHFLIPPYVSTAHMTSLLSHHLHHDRVTHFWTVFFFPFQRLTEWGGEAKHSADPQQLPLWCYNHVETDIISSSLSALFALLVDGF